MTGGGPETAGIGDLLHQLVEDMAEVARAEVAVQRARIVGKVASYRSAVLLFVIAGTLGFATVIALLVGLILILTPAVGSGWATALVCGAALALTIMLALLGRGQLASANREGK